MTPFYRQYDLPWTVSEEDEQRFRKILIAVLVLFVLLGFLFPLLPKPERSHQIKEELPPRLAKLMMEQQAKPPPPPPPPKEAPKPETKPQTQPEPKPIDRQQRAKERAAAALMPLDALADLRDNKDVNVATAQRPLTDATRAGDVAERSMITSKVGRGSGGINTSNMSRGFGGGGGGTLAGRSTTQVGSNLEGDPRGASRTGSSGKAARSREEIELVFDRNKGAIYALYNRALRGNPTLQGKVVLELTISPAGDVTQCRVVSSELKDPDLENKLVTRVKMFKFEARDVETITTTKPIDFFPA